MARSALEIVQAASARLSVDRPTAVFNVDDPTAIDLREALNEAALEIVEAADWQALKAVHSHAGDGGTTEFALPSDFLRMPKDAQVWTTRWQSPLEHISPEQWLGLDIQDYDAVSGAWALYGGNFVYKPALESDETAKFFYVSRSAVSEPGGAVKERFTDDADTFRLDDRVLELMMIAIFRESKELPVGGDASKAQRALERAISRDKAARFLKQSVAVGMGSNADALAYPFGVPV